MNRDYDINKTLLDMWSRYENHMTRESTLDVLKAFNINFTYGNYSTSDIIRELMEMERRSHRFSDKRQLTDAIAYFTKTELATAENPAYEETEETYELDAFLETFKITQGGVSA